MAENSSNKCYNVYDELQNAYSKTRLKRPLRTRQNQGHNRKRYINEGLMYSRMLPLEHSAILLTLIKR